MKSFTGAMMNVRVRFAVCLLMAGLWPMAAVAQDIGTQAGMHARVVSLYNFHPAKLSDAERTAKSNQMDKFWTEAKANPARTLPLLRIELRNAANPAFFMMDGSSLLMEMSKAAADKDIAVAAMARSDLSDVVPQDYFTGVLRLTVQGVDTTVAALHILDDPKFGVPVPQHAMVLNQAQSLMYLLVPLDPARWFPAAERRFAVEKDETALESLLELFFFAQTPDGDRMIEMAAHDPRSAELRKSALGSQAAVKEALKHKIDVKGTEASIRADRKRRLNFVSDEAVDDVQEMTMRLVQLRHGAK